MARRSHLIEVRHLGLTAYSTGLAVQEACWERIAARLAEDPQAVGGGEILTLEHPTVITFGRREKGQNLRVERDTLQKRGVELFEIGRGGLATLHSPGQLVVYPILPIQRWGMGIKEYVAALEEAAVNTCGDLGVAAESGHSSAGRLPVGVWVAGAKLAQIGIQVRRGITLHGIALNVANDLSLFELLHPCGLGGIPVTSLHKLLQTTGKDLETSPVAHLFIKNLLKYL